MFACWRRARYRFRRWSLLMMPALWHGKCQSTLIRSPSGGCPEKRSGLSSGSRGSLTKQTLLFCVRNQHCFVIQKYLLLPQGRKGGGAAASKRFSTGRSLCSDHFLHDVRILYVIRLCLTGERRITDKPTNY